jgi:hypothetical protein
LFPTCGHSLPPLPFNLHVPLLMQSGYYVPRADSMHRRPLPRLPDSYCSPAARARNGFRNRIVSRCRSPCWPHLRLRPPRTPEHPLCSGIYSLPLSNPRRVLHADVGLGRILYWRPLGQSGPRRREVPP